MKKQIGLLIFILLLNACASVPDKNIQLTNKPLKDNEGLVVAEVINNSERIAGVIRDWEELILVKVDEPDETKRVVSISALTNPSSSFLFAGRLKTGLYRIGLLYTYLKIGDTSYTARAVIPPSIGEFEVTQGQITNLGTILYHPFQQIHYMEKQMPDYAVTRIENPDLMPFIFKQHPDILQFINSDQINSWKVDESTKDRNKAFDLIKSSAVLEYYYPLKEGEFVAAGKLGSLYHFLPSDIGYKKIQVPTKREVSAFTATPDGNWIIGGEYGLLKKSSPPYTDWLDIELNDSLNHILDIQSNSNGDVFILSFGGYKYNVYQFTDEDKTKLLKTFVPKKSFFYDSGYRPQIKLSDDYLQVLSEEKIFSLNLSDDTEWLSEEVTETFETYYQGNEIQFASKYMTWSWSGLGPLLFSKDGGDSWSRVSSDNEVSNYDRPFLFSDGEMLILKEKDDIKLFRKTNVYNTVQAKLSKDGGLTWQNKTSLPKSCDSIMHSVSDDKGVYVRCSNGGIHLTRDRGRSWAEVLWNHQIPLDEFPENFVVPLSEFRNK